MVNLLSNAIKFTFEGFIKIGISIATTTDVDDDSGALHGTSSSGTIGVGEDRIMDNSQLLQSSRKACLED